MIGADASASLRILNDSKHSSSNSKGTSLANNLVIGLSICENYKCMIKTTMTKKASDSFYINRWR